MHLLRKEIMYLLLAPEISGTGESTTHHRCRPRIVVADRTLWLEVEEGRENRAHTQHKHQRWPKLYR